MATKYLKFKGFVKWAKVYEPDNYNDILKYTLAFYPENGAEWEKFRKSGIKLKVKDDPNGEGQFVNIKRPVEKTFGSKDVIFTPPIITGKVNVHYIDPENPTKPLRSYDKGTVAEVQRVGESVSIGNGSRVIVTICTYETKSFGIGSRLESLEILDLVEYNPDAVVEEEDVPDDAVIVEDEEDNKKKKTPW